MASLSSLNSACRTLYKEVKSFHLRPVKRLIFQFDPFHENAKSVRDFLYHISSKRVRRTNVNCLFKTEVVNDRSEPSINLALSNGMNVLFKCANLSVQDISQEFNKIVTKFDVPDEEPTIKLKGTSQKQARKRN